MTRESPTFRLSDVEPSTTPSIGKKHSSGHDRFFNEAEAELLEHEHKKNWIGGEEIRTGFKKN